MKLASLFVIAALSGVLIMSPTVQPLPVNAPFTLAQLKAAARNAGDHGRYAEALELLDAADETPAALVFVHFQGGHEDEVRGFTTEAEAIEAIKLNR